MIRAILATIVLMTLGISRADDSVKQAPAKPIGTWTRAVEGGSWTLSIEQSRIVFKGVGSNANEPVYTAIAPHYEVSEEGILYGYVRELTSQRGDDLSTSKVVHPFAFRLKVADETMTISDLSMRSADARTHADLTGEFKKVTELNAAKPDSPAKELKR